MGSKFYGSYWPRRTQSLEGNRAVLVACLNCDKTWIPRCEDGTVDLDVCWKAMEGFGECPRCKSSVIDMAYYEADKCAAGCGKWLERDADPSSPLAGCCSRRCRLVKEWQLEISTRMQRDIWPRPWAGYVR